MMGAGVNDPDIITLEVSGGLATASLILVFLPFFLGGLQRGKEKMSQSQIRWTRRLVMALPVAVATGAATSTVGLLTLWDQVDLALLTAILSIVTIWLVVVLAGLAVAYELILLWR